MSDFCPRCGTARTGELRFCRSCGYDMQPFDNNEAAVRPLQPLKPTTPVAWSYTPPVQPEPQAGKRGFGLIEGSLLVAIVAAVAVVAVVLSGNQLPSLGPVGAAATTAPTAAATIRQIPTREPTPVETPLPPVPTQASGPITAKPGETTTLFINDVAAFKITIDQVSQHTSYTGQYSPDKPKAGYIYIQAFATYEALIDGVDYNPYDWQVFVNGTAVETYTVLLNGPEPELGSGVLPKGRKASGWLVYEIPKAGRALLSYGSGYKRAPIFEVVIRDS